MHASLSSIEQFQDCFQSDQIVDNNNLTTPNTNHLNITFPTSIEGFTEYSLQNVFSIEQTTCQKGHKTLTKPIARLAPSSQAVQDYDCCFTSNVSSHHIFTTYAKENVWPI